MPTDYAAIMLEIQKKLIDFYTNNSFPDGNNKSTQFEIAVFEASKEVFATYDRNNGLPQDYHTVEYLGGNIFPDIIIHIGATGQKVGMEVKYHSSSNDWKTKGNSTYGTTQVDGLVEIIYVFLTIFLYLLKCPQSLILSALRAFCFCGKPHISRSIFLYFRYQAWLKSW